MSAWAESWPRWRGPRGDGTWHGPELPERWPDGGPRQVWRTAVGGGYAGIVTANGRVMTMDRQTEPDEAERVLCFRAADGQPLWTHRYPVRYGDLSYGSGPRAAPTIDGDRVYTLGSLGHLHCLRAETGEPLWSKDLVADYGAQVPEWGFAASPLVWRELVIVHVGAKPEGCLLAFDRASGRLAWRGGTDPAGYATPIVVRHRERELLIAWTPAHVVGHDPETGKVLWTIPYKVTYGVSIATPIFHEDLVFVAGYWEGSKAIRLGARPADAELAWEDERLLRGLMSQPLYREGRVYLLDKGYGLTCFELASGRKLWDDGHRVTPRERNPQATLVWLGDTDRTIILNAQGELILARLRPEGYEEQSRAKIIDPTWAHPAYDGRFCFARSDTQLVCVELAP